MQKLISVIVGVILTCSYINLVQADQNHPELPKLFEQLKNSSGPQQTVMLEAEIWRKWAEHESGGVEIIAKSMSSGHYSMALDTSNSLVVNYPEFAEGWNRRATIFYLLGDYDGAFADLEKALTLEPRHFGAISGVGLMMNETGNKYQAFLAFQKVLEISPHNIGAKKAIEELDMGREDSI